MQYDYNLFQFKKEDKLEKLDLNTILTANL